MRQNKASQILLIVQHPAVADPALEKGGATLSFPINLPMAQSDGVRCWGGGEGCWGLRERWGWVVQEVMEVGYRGGGGTGVVVEGSVGV